MISLFGKPEPTLLERLKESVREDADRACRAIGADSYWR